jgi:hypothetical protein
VGENGKFKNRLEIEFENNGAVECCDIILWQVGDRQPFFAAGIRYRSGGEGRKR